MRFPVARRVNAVTPEFPLDLHNTSAEYFLHPAYPFKLAKIFSNPINATLKSIDYNVAMTFILNNNNNN